jgi:F-type H+-transporting ATPase subunit alpha
MKFKADEIVSVLSNEISQYRGQLAASEVGRVLEVGDGIARVSTASPGAMAGEMVEFTRSGVRGMAFNLEENSVGVIILGDYLEDFAKATRSRAPEHSSPSRSAKPSSVASSIRSATRSTARDPSSPRNIRPLETTAPGVAGRQPVKQPFQTGHQGRRRHDPGRSRSARTDHR